MESGISQKRLLDIEGISTHLDVSIKTIYSWVSQRKIPYIKMGHLIRFDTTDIENWIAANKVEPYKL